MQHLVFQNHKIPALGLGTWRLSGGECAKVVAGALGAGYRHVDTAQIYENEAEVGQGIKSSGVPRADIFLTTKVWMTNVGKDRLASSVEESLRRLATDYVDLLLLHWPVDEVPLEDQLASLQAVQKAGKARLIGVSNFTVPQLEQATQAIGPVLATNQVEYHPFLSQKPVLKALRGKGMFLTAYSPLARGKVGDDKTIRAIADAHGKTPGQIALRWLVQQGDVAAIPKTAKTDRLRENLEIFDFALSEAEMETITALGKDSGRMINPDWAPAWDKAA